jgi:hypothetical protein
LDDTRQPSAAGNNHTESAATAPASAQQQKARTAIVVPMAQRRPRRNRSRNGPISGATIANGSMVRARNSATWSRASPVGTLKNTVPARATATAASPAVLKACISSSRASPLSPAPCACVSCRALRTLRVATRPVTAPVARATWPVALAA